MLRLWLQWRFRDVQVFGWRRFAEETVYSTQVTIQRTNEVIDDVLAKLFDPFIPRASPLALENLNEEESNTSPSISDAIWLAVPKRKVSVHKRRLRRGPQQLKPITHYERCLSCGEYKLRHKACPGCLRIR